MFQHISTFQKSKIQCWHILTLSSGCVGVISQRSENKTKIFSSSLIFWPRALCIAYRFTTVRKMSRKFFSCAFLFRKWKWLHEITSENYNFSQFFLPDIRYRLCQDFYRTQESIPGVRCASGNVFNKGIGYPVPARILGSCSAQPLQCSVNKTKICVKPNILSK